MITRQSRELRVTFVRHRLDPRFNTGNFFNYCYHPVRHTTNPQNSLYAQRTSRAFNLSRFYRRRVSAPKPALTGQTMKLRILQNITSLLRNYSPSHTLLLTLLVLLLLESSTTAAPFTPNNIVVYRVG